MFGLSFLGKASEIMVTSNFKDDVLEIQDLVYDISDTVSTITLTDSYSNNVTFNGEVTINKDCETIKLIETLKEQKMQIEALSDIITDMVVKKDFNIEYDLEKRVEQKRFLNRLRGT